MPILILSSECTKTSMIHFGGHVNMLVLITLAVNLPVCLLPIVMITQTNF